MITETRAKAAGFALSSIRADVFPAMLAIAPPESETRATTLGTLPDTIRVVEKVRVIVTLDRIVVFADSAKGPHVIFSERMDDYVAPMKATRQTIRTMGPTEAQVTTSSGKTLAFRKAGGCGCGSKLKSFDPFPTLSSFRSKVDV